MIFEWFSILQKSFEAGALSQGTQVFVHGLKENISEQDLAEYFGRYGVIVRVDIPNNKATGKRLNYGFVTFDDYDTVDKIIRKSMQRYFSRFVF